LQNFFAAFICGKYFFHLYLLAVDKPRLCARIPASQ
jgi:hypothetical protein